ncbi:hypothetical protein PPERSA_10589 [Pseudocohnilembus persalinus]|uniref:Uncharacterized protein n=1 Tax=Pseudocohnilembus persalinus TaxID=266149 RepID=A0A0V0Q998_PSEPJ|nr:hypothetical protein PPERSA_10589 [Pseudocohnilembus persalinus]|eukprot:KRW98818.1 hypothetical protein PPERSA_10589 [Pseudocohnilembus persalinus]
MGSINLNNPCSILYENQGQTITQMNNLDMSDQFGLDYDINLNQDCFNEKSYNNNNYQFDQNLKNNSFGLGSQEKQSNFYSTDNNQQQQNNLNFDFEFNNVRNEREETDSQTVSRDSKLLKKKIYKKNYNKQQISNQRQKAQKQKLVGSDNSPEIQKIKKNFWKNLSRHFFYHLKHASVIIRKEVLEERFNLNKQQCEKFAKKYGTGKLKMNNKEEFLSLLFPVAISSKQQLIQQQQQNQQNCQETQLFKKILRILLLRFMRRDMFQHSTQVSRIQNWYLFFIQRHTLAKQVQGHCLKKLFF